MPYTPIDDKLWRRCCDAVKAAEEARLAKDMPALLSGNPHELALRALAVHNLGGYPHDVSLLRTASELFASGKVPATQSNLCAFLSSAARVNASGVDDEYSSELIEGQVLDAFDKCVEEAQFFLKSLDPPAVEAMDAMFGPRPYIHSPDSRPYYYYSDLMKSSRIVNRDFTPQQPEWDPSYDADFTSAVFFIYTPEDKVARFLTVDLFKECEAGYSSGWTWLCDVHDADMETGEVACDPEKGFEYDGLPDATFALNEFTSPADVFLPVVEDLDLGEYRIPPKKSISGHVPPAYLVSGHVPPAYLEALADAAERLFKVPVDDLAAQREVVAAALSLKTESFPRAGGAGRERGLEDLCGNLCGNDARVTSEALREKAGGIAGPGLRRLSR